MRVSPDLKIINKHHHWIVTIPVHLKTEEICNEAVRTEPLLLVYVPDHFKTQEMCNEARGTTSFA